MKTICAWCSVTPVGETVSHGICADCMRTHFPDLADDSATHFPDRVAGNPAKASVPDCSGVEAGCSLVVHYRAEDLERIDRWKDDTLLGAARRLVAKCMDEGTNDPDCLPGGIEFDEPRRSLFSPRNRFRRGVLGNLMLRSGALRRVA